MTSNVKTSWQFSIKDLLYITAICTLIVQGTLNQRKLTTVNRNLEGHIVNLTSRLIVLESNEDLLFTRDRTLEVRLFNLHNELLDLKESK